MIRTVRVDLPGRSYEIRIGPGVLAALGETVAGLGSARQVLAVTSDGIPPQYHKAACESVRAAGLFCCPIVFPAQPSSEASKNLRTLEAVLDAVFAAEPAVDRAAVVAAVGGGVVGDVAGFAAAVTLRGIRFVQCPTTLLAAVDASVGGKTGVDHPAGKNLIGAFHQPRAVLIDVTTLKTLPRAELANGLAECVKHAAIRDEAMLDFIEANAAAIFAADEDVLTDLIARNVAIKAGVVSRDEREAGERAHLNFGHTVGHAVEAFVGYEHMAHGAAVSLGMVAAAALAQARGRLSDAEAARLKEVLAKLELPVRRPGMDADGLWRILQHDKKARGGKVRMVLPAGRLGTAELCEVTEPEVRAAIAAIS